MATYVEVINNDGKISIDDNTARLCRTRTLSLTPGYYVWDYAYIYGVNRNDDAMGGFSEFTINLEPNEKFVAVRAKTGHDNVVVFADYINSTTIKLYLNGSWSNPNTYADDYLVDVYGYDPRRSYQNGLQVFNASGVKIFDSNEYFMDVVGKFDIDLSYLAPLDFATQYPSIIDIPGNYSHSNRSVVIGVSMRRPITLRNNPGALYQALYGIRFGTDGRIALGLRASTFILSYSYPYALVNFNSGIVLNHNNIPLRNDGTLA